MKQPENSDVLPNGPVAVAVITVPDGSGPGIAGLVHSAIPTFVVVTGNLAIDSRPSPKPDGSQLAPRNSSMVKVVLGVESSVPDTSLADGVEVAPVTTGVFCSSFGPGSPSPASLAVTPSSLRSMPRP